MANISVAQGSSKQLLRESIKACIWNSGSERHLYSVRRVVCQQASYTFDLSFFSNGFRSLRGSKGAG